MKIAAFLTIALASGSLYANGVVPKASGDSPASRTGTTVAGGEVIVRGIPSTLPGAGLVPGGENRAPLEPIELSRDFRDSPPANLVRGELEAANGEND